MEVVTISTVGVQNNIRKMRKTLIAFLIIGTCGMVYSSPIPDNSTPSFQTIPTSTEKIANDAHSTIALKKGEKEISPTTPSTTTKLPDHPKAVTENHSDKGYGVTSTKGNKNEGSSSLQSHKEEPAVTPSSNKPEIKDLTTSSFGLKEKETTTTSSDHKVESKNPSATGQKGPTTIKPVIEDQKKNPKNNQKPTKTSTAYFDKGKVVVFNGICGPDGCEIEGDIYDELVPLPHAKKQV